MNCRESRTILSSYLDGAVSGAEMRSVSGHLISCGDCAIQYEQLARTQKLVAAAGRKQAPPDLALRIRVAISQERNRTPRRRLQGFLVRAQNSLNAFAFPATTAGVVAAVLLFALLVAVNPAPVTAASANDIPLYTPPKIAASPFYNQFTMGDADGPIVVETLVDSRGRVQDYRIVAGEDSPRMRTQVAKALIFTVFEPARSVGRPVPSRIVISFNNVMVSE